MIVKLATDKEIADDIGLATLRILSRKQEFTGGLHTLGTHFGEFCVMSKLGIRAETATPAEITEVFYYDKEDIWELFVGMPFSERYRFLLAMFTEVGGISHSKDVEQSAPPSDGLVGKSIRHLYKLSALIVDDILATYGKRADDDSEVEVGSVSTAVMKQTKLRRTSLMSNDCSDEESRDEPAGMSKWTDALKAYDRTRTRRKSSRMGMSIKSAAGFSTGGDIEDVDSLTGDEENPFGTLEKRIRALFAYIDKDGSGSIDKNELMLSLLDLGIERSWADVESMISFADKDGDAEVDLEELVAAIIRELKRETEKNKVKEDNSDDDLLSDEGDAPLSPVHTIPEEETHDEEALAAASAFALEVALEGSGLQGGVFGVDPPLEVGVQDGPAACDASCGGGDVDFGAVASDGGDAGHSPINAASPRRASNASNRAALGETASNDVALGDRIGSGDGNGAAVDTGGLAGETVPAEAEVTLGNGSELFDGACSGVQEASGAPGISPTASGATEEGGERGASYQSGKNEIEPPSPVFMEPTVDGIVVDDAPSQSGGSDSPKPLPVENVCNMSSTAGAGKTDDDSKVGHPDVEGIYLPPTLMRRGSVGSWMAEPVEKEEADEKSKSSRINEPDGKPEAVRDYPPPAVHGFMTEEADSGTCLDPVFPATAEDHARDSFLDPDEDEDIAFFD